MSTRNKSEAVRFLENLMGEELSFGGLLRSIREGKEMTQVEFSECLGISRQYLCDIEKNRRLVSPRTAAAFAQYLGYSPEQFVRLALQGLLDKEGLDLVITIKAA